jgi:hypothetical protein
MLAAPHTAITACSAAKPLNGNAIATTTMSAM